MKFIAGEFYELTNGARAYVSRCIVTRKYPDHEEAGFQIGDSSEVGHTYVTILADGYDATRSIRVVRKVEAA